MRTYDVIGVMSGTSMDGLDIAYCRITSDNDHYEYELRLAQTIPYSLAWRERLTQLFDQNAVTLAQVHTFYGQYVGMLLRDFMQKNDLQRRIDFISFHGQTIYHQPHKNYTLQIGNGAAVAAETGKPVVTDFRSTDVALGGQGAPLVPVGDLYLFRDYAICLNLGGIANLSFKQNGTRITGYDICGCNLLLNALAEEKGLHYDRDGLLAEKGKVNPALLERLNGWDFLDEAPPKTLGVEALLDGPLTWLQTPNLRTEDKLATVAKHISMQIAKAVEGCLKKMDKKPDKEPTVLVTGGGALNKYLVKLLEKDAPVPIHLPDANVINFKEAIIFAFLGVRRWEGKVNILASVTGASRDSIGGAVYLP